MVNLFGKQSNCLLIRGAIVLDLLGIYGCMGTSHTNADPSGNDITSTLKILSWPDENSRPLFPNNHFLKILERFISPIYQAVFTSLFDYIVEKRRKVNGPTLIRSDPKEEYYRWLPFQSGAKHYIHTR